MFNNGLLLSRTTGGTEITGTGTANTIAMFTGAQTIGNSTITQTAGGTGITITQTAAATGSPRAFRSIGAAHTTLTASTEVIDAYFNYGRIVQFNTGAITDQRCVFIEAPTYAFVGASTITNAATLTIQDAPSAGSNATITNSDALWVQAGNTRLGGALRFTTAIGTVTTDYRIYRDSSGAFNQLAYNVPTGTGHVWNIASAAVMKINTTDGFIVDINGSGTQAYIAAQAAYAEVSCYAANSRVYLQAGNAGVGAIDIDHNLKYVQFNSPLSTGTTATGFNFVGAAHTTITASTEKIETHFNLGQTVQHATGALTTQRAFVITAPTYSFVAASTITNAATLAINAAPTAGTNATITNSYALWVQGGNSLFAGLILAGSAPTTLTDSTGKILSAALNTVAVANGGTGVTTGVWVDYSGSSTIVGWSSFTTQIISYMVLLDGSIMVAFNLVGTSDATSVTFTLPETPLTALGTADLTIRAVNNGTAAVGFCRIAGGSTTVTCFPAITGGAWTASGSKQVSGMFVIPIN